MATNAWSASYNHDNDANFRIWGDDLSTKWQALGLVQTADTGQINWATATRPGSLAYAGYEIYYLNDTLHASAPVYIKVEFGTGNTATRPALRVTMGTGSNGSGTITNPTSAVVAYANAGGFTGASLNHYACFTNGIFWYCGGFGGAATGLANLGFMVARTCDSTGAATNVGALIYAINAPSSNSSAGNGIYQAIRFNPSVSVKSSSSTTLCYYPANFNDTTVLANGNYGAMVVPYAFPEVSMLRGVSSVSLAALASGSTVSFQLFPGTTQTYMAIGAQMSRICEPVATSSTITYQALLLWE